MRSERAAGEAPARVTPDEYLGEVLDLVARVPPGRAVTYGSLAEVLRDRLGVGGPRQVGSVLARAGGDVPWWRVVNAAGRPPLPYRREALERLRAEGCPLRGEGVDARVALRTALWWPEDDDGVDVGPEAEDENEVGNRGRGLPGEVPDPVRRR